MSADGFMRLKTLSGKGKVKVASRHNKRAIQAEHGAAGHIDAARMHLNLLCGGEVVKECKDGRVWYWNEKGTLTSIGLDRFETIFSEQKPSTG